MGEFSPILEVEGEGDQVISLGSLGPLHPWVGGRRKTTRRRPGRAGLGRGYVGIVWRGFRPSIFLPLTSIVLLLEIDFESVSIWA